jgi:phenylalanyl-tRNA synthetase alpha chain
LQKKIEQYLEEIRGFIPANSKELEDFRIRFLGRKGIMGDLFEEMKTLSPEFKKDTGRLMNELKKASEEKLLHYKGEFENTEEDVASNLDLSRPGEASPLGARHPLSIVRNRIIRIFSGIGFVISEGPEIEDDWHNFGALNFPPEHPARDMQDTFFIEKEEDREIALRTHTSSVQVRVMENSKPPIRTISPGRVYRNEAISARAHCIFHQIEGLYIDKDVSFADLKQTLLYFAREFFGNDTKIRLRPSYFPFTEPSAEMDISCNICGGSGCNICKHSGWVEILGCGMVDPNVLENCGINSKEYSGFAFGMGIERITMLKYQINDLRVFFENDLRFLEQFRSFGV